MGEILVRFSTFCSPRAQPLGRRDKEGGAPAGRAEPPPARPAPPNGPGTCPQWTRTHVRTRLGRCSCASMPPTGSSSSSRSGAARSRPRTPRGTVLKLGSAVPVGLARSLLDEAVRDDARLRWAGDLVALAAAPGEALAARAGDLRRLRPRDDRASSRDARGRARSARCGCEELELDGALPDAREPRRAAAAGGRRADRPARRGAAARAAGRGRRCGASSRSPATRCSSRTTRASTWRSSTTRRCG